MTRSVFLVLVGGVAIGASRLAAQDAQFGVPTLGTPGRLESVRARSAAGAFAPFDAGSPLVEAPAAAVLRSTIQVVGYSASRSLDFDAGGSASLRQARFPALSVAWRSPFGLTLSAGFATYLDRTWQVRIRDSLSLRGVSEAFTDQLDSDGSISDLRLAAAHRVSRHLSIGVGFHVLTGATRESARRAWDDSVTYLNTTQRNDVSYDGLGGSASLVADLPGPFRLAGWVRSDSRLRAQVDSRPTSERDLPFQAGGALEWSARPALRVAASLQWAGWAGATPDAHDTFGWAVGAEAGTPTTPVRFGVRRGTLPFGAGAAPREFGLSLGAGRVFASGRARVDLGLERLSRDGPGLTEGVWTLLLGIAIQP